MELIILTGMSGAGKSQAAAFFEDKGYYCIDNLLPQFLPQLAETFINIENESGNISKVCFVVDIRSRALLKELGPALKKLDDEGISYNIVFLEASDEVLVSRYRQTRRTHPLMDEMSLTDAIKSERKMLTKIRGRATNIIDTTMTTNAGLKKELRTVAENLSEKGLSILVESFGFMYGMPSDNDDVFDVRFLPNPFWVDDLKMMSGLDEPIAKYLESFDETNEFIDKITNLFEFMIPFYVREGKSRLSIGIGCTGGRHRSVYVTETLGKKLTELGYRTIINHRDIDRDPRYATNDTKPTSL